MDFRDIFGELDVKGRQQSFMMRGSELIEAMAVAVDRLVNARESASGLDRAIETIVNTMGRFNSKDVSTYLEDYKDEILIWDIP